MTHPPLTLHNCAQRHIFDFNKTFIKISDKIKFTKRISDILISLEIALHLPFRVKKWKI